MTDAQEPHEIDGPHEGPIKTPKQLILAVIYSFVIPIATILLLAFYVTSQGKRAAGSSNALGVEAVTQRLRPVGHVEVKDATDVASLKTGEQVFGAQCTACHTPGTLNAPKLGDVAAWSDRVKTGLENLVKSAVQGKGAMPPQAGGDFSEFEVARAVVFMANKSGASFAEPKAPASTDAAAAAGAPAAPAVTAPALTTATTTASPNVDANAGRPTGDTSAPVGTAATTTTSRPTPAAAQSAIVAAAAGGAAPAVYTQNCTVCHGAGIAGAPKVGDKSAWAPRVAQGIDTLTAHAIQGKGAMPPRGGSTANDADIRAAVTYMVNASK